VRRSNSDGIREKFESDLPRRSCIGCERGVTLLDDDTDVGVNGVSNAARSGSVIECASDVGLSIQ
jgi:hypothetical protein